MKLECAQRISSSFATAADIDWAFTDDQGRGEFIILTADDGGFLQAAGEGDGPFLLEVRSATGDENLRAAGELTKDQVRAAFLSYLAGNDTWRTAHEWAPVEERAGCRRKTAALLSLLAAVLVAASTAVAAN